MNVLVVLLLMLGGFLIMDAVGDKRTVAAEREAKRVVKYVPLSIFDEQLSGRSMRDEFADMFQSTGPWMFRDDVYAASFPDYKSRGASTGSAGSVAEGGSAGSGSADSVAEGVSAGSGSAGSVAEGGASTGADGFMPMPAAYHPVRSDPSGRMKKRATRKGKSKTRRG